MSRLWDDPGHLRLVVLDLETCVGPDNAHRIISVGIAVCRGGAIKERREWLVNPGCPVDAFTFSKHNISDKHLADEAPLDEVWPALLRYLTGKPGETVVLAAHWTSFDVPVLRNDLARVNAGPLPEMPVLNTAGSLCSLAGLRTRKRNLTAVIAELDIINEFAHNALSDATATAKAAIKMLALAEAAGHDDLAALLVSAGDEHTGSVKMMTPRQVRNRDGLAPIKAPLSDAHVEAHATATDETLGALVAACAGQRCGSLTGTVLALPPATARRHLLAALAAATDDAGAATVLGALAPLLAMMPPAIKEARRECPGLRAFPGTGGPRGVAVSVADWISTTTAAFTRCPENDPCPACRHGQPCPLDVWPDSLVPLALDPTPETVIAFWHPTALGAPTSKGGGKGWLSMRRNAPPLAEAVLRACHAFWMETAPATADSVVDTVWAVGCRDPFITEARVVRIAIAGRPADLRAALADCEAVLKGRDGSTDPAWASLAVRAAQLEGRLLVLEDPKHRRARQAHAKRPPRPTRFLRATIPT